jgi:hypothetical protein
MTSNNVITFPKPYEGPMINGKSVKEIHDNVEMMKQYHIQETVYNLAPLIFNHLEVSGFELVDEDDNMLSIRDGALILESIKSLLSKHYNIYHPFQTLSEHVFLDDEPGTLKIAESLNIEMIDPENKGEM